MRTFVLPLAILGALAACNDSPSETAQAPPRDAAETAAPAPPETASPSPAASTIPAVIQGRWGLTDADCEPGRDDAKGLLTITANELDFYESVGTLDDIKDADAITAAFTRALGHVRPTGTLVAIAALYHPSWKVEIEAEAVVGDDR